MHFISLVTVTLPPITEDRYKDEEIQNQIRALKERQAAEKDNLFLQLAINSLRCKSTEFSRCVSDAVEKIMEPYCENTDNPDYLEFVDMTEELKAEYEEETECIRLPEGKIVELQNYPYYLLYTVQDGKVCQRKAGPVKQSRRTKKTKKIEALGYLPRKKVYKSFQKYADHQDYEYDEKQQAYGYYTNPKAMWDWYEIGGRWKNMFLVKSTCRDYSAGEGGLDTAAVPEGYMWVAAARKNEIAWDKMREWKIHQATLIFQRLETMFHVGRIDPDCHGKLVDDGIIDWNGYLYRKDETLNEYLERRGIPQSWKYPINVHDIVNPDEWKTPNSRDINEWHTVLDQYIDRLDENTVLVGVDYHV